MFISALQTTSVFNPAVRGATDLYCSFIFTTFRNTMVRVEVNNVTVSQGVRMLFSLMTPNESSFETVQEVPKYVNQVSLTSLPRYWKMYKNKYELTHILIIIRATQCLTTTHSQRVEQSLHNSLIT